MLNTSEPRVSIGLHLTLTAPFRPVSEAFKPTRDGAFLPLMKMGVESFLRRLDPAALVEEIAAQLRQFVDLFGRAPAFIDGHQHAHLFPQVRDALLKVAQEDAPTAWLRQSGSASSLLETIRNRKSFPLDLMSWSFRRRAAAVGVKTNPGFAGAYEFRDDVEFATLFPRFLDRLPDGSLVMCHPGFVDGELRRLDSLTILREREYAYFCSEAFPEALAAHGLVLAPASMEPT
jgi:predicted glycoside hydrolase/deacetylase ChbG (UPF0249 family)